MIKQNFVSHDKESFQLLLVLKLTVTTESYKNFVQQVITCTLSEESSNPRSSILSAPFSLENGIKKQI